MSTVLHGSKGRFEGELISELFEPATSVVKRLVSELFLLDVMIRHRYSEKEGAAKGEPNLLVTESKIRAFLEKETNGEEMIELFTKTGEIRFCLKDKGFFLFN